MSGKALKEKRLHTLGGSKERSRTPAEESKTTYNPDKRKSKLRRGGTLRIGNSRTPDQLTGKL